MFITKFSIELNFFMGNVSNRGQIISATTLFKVSKEDGLDCLLAELFIPVSASFLKLLLALTRKSWKYDNFPVIRRNR